MCAAEQRHFNSDFVGEAGLADEIERSPNALTVADLSRFLKISDQTAYRMCLDGTIPHFRIRGSIRFDGKAVARWLRKQSVSTP